MSDKLEQMTRRDFNKTAVRGIGKAFLALSGLGVIAQACVAPHVHRKDPMEEAIERAVFDFSWDDLDHNNAYLVLINKYHDVRHLSRLCGFSGNYGHIEVFYNGDFYGCRPGVCGEISVNQAKGKFSGSGFEVRHVDIKCDTETAIHWFKKNLEGVQYDLFYNNCTDAVVRMYDAGGDTTRRVYPVDVKDEYNSNTRLRNFMKENGIPLPTRKHVFFPDQFENVGTLVGKGVF